MSAKFMFVSLLLWGAFLVLVGTFGGAVGLEVSGAAAAVTFTLVLCYGFYSLMWGD